MWEHLCFPQNQHLLPWCSCSAKEILRPDTAGELIRPTVSPIHRGLLCRTAIHRRDRVRQRYPPRGARRPQDDMFQEFAPTLEDNMRTAADAQPARGEA
jgi:hypothetical protein